MHLARSALIVLSTIHHQNAMHFKNPLHISLLTDHFGATSKNLHSFPGASYQCSFTKKVWPELLSRIRDDIGKEPVMCEFWVIFSSLLANVVSHPARAFTINCALRRINSRNIRYTWLMHLTTRCHRHPKHHSRSTMIARQDGRNFRIEGRPTWKVSLLCLESICGHCWELIFNSHSTVMNGGVSISSSNCLLLPLNIGGD